jgi:hypothetical protein
MPNLKHEEDLKKIIEEKQSKTNNNLYKKVLNNSNQNYY